jgi:hypothetical protein
MKIIYSSVQLNTTRTTDTTATPIDKCFEICERILLYVSKDSCTQNQCLNNVNVIRVSQEQITAVIQMRQL